MMLIESAAPHLETLLNRKLKDSLTAREFCATLSGKVLEIDIAEIKEKIFIAPIAETIEILIDADIKPDVVFSGGAFAFLKATQTKPMDLVKKGELKMKGDAVMAGQFQRLIDLSMPDWQEEIAQLFGDYVGPHVSQLLEGFASLGQSFMQGFTKDSDPDSEKVSSGSTHIPSADNIIEGVKAVGDEVSRGLQDLSKRFT